MIFKLKKGPSLDERRAPLERWMWVWLESGIRPEWAHEGIDSQDLKDLIATALRSNMK